MYGYAVGLGERISIHALLAESDASDVWLRRNIVEFLSTLSLRRATGIGLVFMWWGVRFLSTLSLRRATVHYDNYNLHCVISIHALLAESDIRVDKIPNQRKIFLSTLSLRRATGYEQYCIRAREISIHALLAESDWLFRPLCS